MATVSVVIPCYNAGPYLAEALASVLGQTRAPDEVIVVDDRSTDGSAEVARGHGVRVLTTPTNSGAAAARNLGAREARGELIAWLDADDVWEPEHLATVAPLAERFPEAAVAFSRTRAFGAGASDEWVALIPEGRPVDAFRESLGRTIVPQNTAVVRRAALLAVGGYDESLRVAEDYDVWLRLSRRYPFVCTHAVTCRLRRHAEQTSRDVYRYWRAEYEVRQRFRARAIAEEPAEFVARLEAGERAVWEQHLRTAWFGRSPAAMRFHLSMHDRVPGSVAVRRRWLLRAALLPLARLWDALPPGFRRIRRRGRGASVEPGASTPAAPGGAATDGGGTLSA